MRTGVAEGCGAYGGFDHGDADDVGVDLGLRDGRLADRGDELDQRAGDLLGVVDDDGRQGFAGGEFRDGWVVPSQVAVPPDALARQRPFQDVSRPGGRTSSR